MTAIIGFTCHDSVLMMADTEESIVRKVMVAEHPGSSRLVPRCGVEPGLAGRSLQLVNCSIG
jgi:hypothetical protein